VSQRIGVACGRGWRRRGGETGREGWLRLIVWGEAAPLTPPAVARTVEGLRSVVAVAMVFVAGPLRVVREWVVGAWREVVVPSIGGARLGKGLQVLVDALAWVVGSWVMLVGLWRGRGLLMVRCFGM